MTPPCPLSELCAPAHAPRIRETLARLFVRGGCPPQEASRLSDVVVNTVSLHPPEAAGEAVRGILAHALSGRSLIPHLLALYRYRRERVCAQVQEWIVGNEVLDLGGGNGLIGKALSNARGVSVTVSDIANYNTTSLPFIPLTDGAVSAPDNSFTTVLLIAVLHHAEDPAALMREAVRLGKRAVVIESVYGEKPQEASLALTTFFDWFVNRVLLGNGIPMPCRYNTLDGWQAFFEAQGSRVAHREFLGEDQPGIPLTHALYVVDHG